MSKKRILIFIFISLILINSNMNYNCFADNKIKHVLILNSFSPKFDRTRKIMTSILSNLSSDKVIVHVENMNSEINDSPIYFNHLSQLYKYKFNNYQFDVVIATNDIACNFLNKYHKYIFPNAPIIGAGVFKYNIKELNDANSFYFVENKVNLTKIISTALSLHPNYKTIFIPINPKISKYYINLAENQKKKFKNVRIITYYDSNIENVLKEIKKLPKESILISSTDFKKNDEIISSLDACDLFSDFKSIPVYSIFDSSLKYGSIGGIVSDSYNEGFLASSIALNILNGKKIKNHNVIAKHHYVFNYDKLKQFNVDFSKLPKNSIIVNQPSKFYNISKQYLHNITIAIIVFLTLIIVFLLSNINKRKKLEENLKKAKERYQNLVEFLPYGVVIHKEGIIQFVNQSALNLMGTTDYTYFKEKNIFDFIHPDYHHIANQRIGEHKKGRFSKLIEEVFIKLDGSHVHVELCSGPFYFDGFQSLVVFRDITEEIHSENLKKQIKQEEEKLKQALEYDKLKTEFFSNLSHELKTPLNLIFSVAQLLESNSKKYPYHNTTTKHINILKQNSYRMLRLVNNLIDITKMDCGYFDIDLKNHNIVSVIEDITLSVAEYVKSKNISLLFDTDIEEKIMAIDPNSIERIMLNLLSNAIKFTNSGDSITVNIYDKEDYIVISVKDTGIGIPPDKIDIIFDRFRQVDKSLTRNHEGSGIGLSLVYSLVKLHNGEINVFSEYNKGSEFIIKLPVTVLKDANIIISDNLDKNEYIEKIDIEFSDIYSLN